MNRGSHSSIPVAGFPSSPICIYDDNLTSYNICRDTGVIAGQGGPTGMKRH